MRLLGLLVGAMLVTTGCLGIGGDDDEEVSPTAGPADAADDATDRARFVRDDVNGTATGVNVAAAALLGSSSAFTVEEGAEHLWLNLSSDGAAVWLSLLPPGCMPLELIELATQPEPGCDGAQSAQGSTVNLTVDAPQAGTWTLETFRGEPGVDDVPYAAPAVQRIAAMDEA